jgi:hypothetical protein
MKKHEAKSQPAEMEFLRTAGDYTRKHQIRNTKVGEELKSQRNGRQTNSE